LKPKFSWAFFAFVLTTTATTMNSENVITHIRRQEEDVSRAPEADVASAGAYFVHCVIMSIFHLKTNICTLVHCSKVDMSIAE
jgi:hypothetical protein